MIARRSLASCLLVGVVGAGLFLTARPAGAADCAPVTAGLDSSLWTTGRGTWLGSAVGQSFLARDTLITQLTVWRPPNDRSVIGAKLFITGVDTTWVPPRPDVQIMLLDGPTLTVYDSDPPGQLIPMRYVIDPPLALPRPGLYAFFVQAEGCWAGESHRLIADSSNDYPYGIYWVTGRALDPCYLRGVSGGEDNTDLCFEVQYCVDVTTRVRRHTWGELKLLYR